jgi:hypothetical protein
MVAGQRDAHAAAVGFPGGAGGDTAAVRADLTAGTGVPAGAAVVDVAGDGHAPATAVR